MEPVTTDGVLLVRKQTTINVLTATNPTLTRDPVLSQNWTDE